MPLRVAEKDGYIYGVNKCCECPHVEARKSSDMTEILGWECGNADADAKAGMEILGFGIPVWCPLPRDEGDGKIRVTGDRIKPLSKKRSPSSLDREYR